LVDLAKGIEAEDLDDTAVGFAQALDALHGGGFAGAVGTYEAEDLAFQHLERSLCDSHGAAIGLADTGYFNDWRHGGGKDFGFREPDSKFIVRSCVAPDRPGFE
jgi:hypothetical protein